MHVSIQNLTLEEKVSLLSGLDFWQSRGIPRLSVPSMFLADGPHGIRRQAAAADHLGLNPSIPATCFPTAATVANSWDIALAEGIGRVLGREAAIQKVQILLGPGMNIKRNPRCGRNFEYFSEDPLLSGKMAGAYARGIQENGVAACLKHFAVNNQETRRLAIDAVIDERSLREIYLTGFEIALKEGNAKVVMSAYNRINGTYANENMHVLHDILRNEWGFEGCVVTDWGGSNDRIAGLLAGNELEMPGTNGESDREVLRAVQAGTIQESMVDDAVARLLCLVEWTTKGVGTAPSEFDVATHNAIARQAAEESIVLLKNEDGLLPLKPDIKVAVIGDFASHPRYQGAGSSAVHPTSLNSALDAFERSDISPIGFEPGFRRYGHHDENLKARATELAAKADVVLLYIGLDEVTEAEGRDRDDLSLPANQIDLIEAISGVNMNIIAVLSCGAVIEMPWLNKVKALVHGYLGGQAGAEAMIRVLTGMVNPSGKLAETYAFNVADIPSQSNFPGGEATVEYREGLYVGYRYFDAHPEQVLFPFGFGLSYTSFEYSDLKVDHRGAELTITNTGSRAGKEIVQLYVSRSSHAVYRPSKELKGFKKIELAAGESQQVRFVFDEITFRYFNIRKNEWDVEAGDYTIMVGSSSQAIRQHAVLSVEGNTADVDSNMGMLPSYFSGSVVSVGATEFEALLGRKLPEANWDRRRPLGENDTVAQCQYARGLFARFFYKSLIFAIWCLPKIGRRDTANLLMVSFYNMPFRGIAKMMGGMVTRPMVGGLLMIVNGHFFKGAGKVIAEYIRNRKENYAK